MKCHNEYCFFIFKHANINLMERVALISSKVVQKLASEFLQLPFKLLLVFSDYKKIFLQYMTQQSFRSVISTNRNYSYTHFKI